MMTQENIPYTADEIKAMVKTIESLRKTQKKYQDALEKVKGLLKDQEMALHAREKLANVFPELKSDDEKIRKAIHIYLDWLDGRKDYAPKGDYTIRDMIAWLEKQDDVNEISAEWSEKDEQMILSIEQIMNCASLLNIVPEKIDNIKSWLKSLKPHKQWTPNAAQLIVIKDLIEDKNTSKVNKVILRGMLDEFKQFTDTRKMEIEKQGENKQEPVQKPFDYEHATIHQKDFAPKVEPKFKVGNWISGYYTNYKVLSVNNAGYVVEDTDGDKLNILFENEKFHHLFTITDAKDGDVLVTEDYIFIFKYILHGGVHLYCHYNFDDEEFDSDIPDAVIGNIHDKGIHFRPATKEERDTLVKAMENAGYMWDSEKKELKKIEPKTLNADEVIKWLKTKVYDDSTYGRAMIEQFKKDFEI